jgi:hypothetical protein
MAVTTLVHSHALKDIARVGVRLLVVMARLRGRNGHDDRADGQ